ncbi:putative D-alanyl-D-alanine carboxypeptidase [Streptomyces sp. NBRC 110611]|uniref:D-alanyl-D-alanine carboxypeptidase family protein n=1 Tax=Streptomyces sp. NBRC 110611 TaxID=1621259 RepID=UPI00082A0943|nr:D-alanyl-D-alanine carboxypeptidase [Streptomyces sp. NBRC 110611]GAU69697.1 putative D-alanyl-D-alanine carboxypeptidase [Streptomyces sp. NBRC 110611]
MPSLRGVRARALTAAAVCAASLLVLPGPACADGPQGIDDLHPAARAAGPPGAGSRLDRHGVQFRIRSDVPEPPRVSALSWMVTEVATGRGSGRILAASDAHRQLPPASTLKTLFALTVLPRFAPGEVHTVSAEELAGIEGGSSLAGLREDTPYRVTDLWHGVFLRSGSDAVHALAAMNGGWDKTIDDMQKTALRLGARDTRVESADGFDTPGQVSSAYDLSLFGQAGLSNPDFARFAATQQADLPEDDPDAFGIQNTNRLLVGSHGVRPYDGLIGVKNGYTSHAGHTLIAAARRDGRTLLVTVMHPRSGGRNAVYEEARALLDWGFEAAPRATAVALLPAMAPGVRTGQAPRSRPAPGHIHPTPGRAHRTPGHVHPAPGRAGRGLERLTSLRGSPATARTEADTPWPYRWVLLSAAAVVAIGVAAFGTRLWRRRRTGRAR